MSERKEQAKLRLRAEALADFSCFTYLGALEVIEERPEIFHKSIKMISGRGIAQLERMLKEMEHER